MAAPLRAVVLRQKSLIPFRGRAWLSTIQQWETSSLLDRRAATGSRPPAASPLRPLSRPASQASSGDQQPRHPWDFKLSPLLAQLILTGSAISFMLYFFVLREESDVDTAIYRPIWERVPGISPDVAERMLEMDKQLGVLYDAREWEASLREYKIRYYANHPDARPKQ